MQSTLVSTARQASPLAKNAIVAIPRAHPSRRGGAGLPYSALDVRCGMCGAYSGKRCVSSRGKRIRYPHRQRIELAAAEYRSTVRLKLLTRFRGFDEEFGPPRLGGRMVAAL